MKKVYRDGTTLDQIIFDGWSRGFLPDQTLCEALAQGYSVTLDQILLRWSDLDKEYQQYFDLQKGDE